MKLVTRVAYEQAKTDEVRACIEAEIWKEVMQYATERLWDAHERAKEAREAMIDAWEAGREIARGERAA